MTQMSRMQFSMHPRPSGALQIARVIDFVGSFMLAAAGTFALTVNATFTESFPNSHLGAVLVLLVLIHLLRSPKFVFNRECIVYGIFVAYMLVQLSWTEDIRLAMNTLTPAITFVVVMILFGSLVQYHNHRAVLAGMLGGVLGGSGIYMLTAGFPFVRPPEFSYNAIAVMFLFGLFIAMLRVCVKDGKTVSLVIGLVFLLLIVATTSIKANLGIVLGVSGAGVIYSRQMARIVRKNALPLVAIVGLIGYFVISSGTLMQTIEAGYDRVILGLELLEARENLPGYSGLDNRGRWARDGLMGWMQNPIFGHGVEAFRSRYGITSHSSPVDLLYNSGIIGFCLFYVIFLSMFLRLVSVKEKGNRSVSALILGMTICFLFITLSGTMHYSSFLAAFVAISTALLSQQSRQGLPNTAPVSTTY